RLLSAHGRCTDEREQGEWQQEPQHGPHFDAPQGECRATSQPVASASRKRDCPGAAGTGQSPHAMTSCTKKEPGVPGSRTQERNLRSVVIVVVVARSDRAADFSGRE